MHFARKKSFTEKLDMAQFESYYIRRMGLPFVDSCTELVILVDTELKF